jgi:hypothetical protein
MKYKLQKKLLSIIVTESMNEKSIQDLNNKDYTEQSKTYLSSCFQTLQNIQQYMDNGCLISQPQDSNCGM